ncbi:hypothetical protein RDABS01_021081 [Bienertia sinuspersici]
MAAFKHLVVAKFKEGVVLEDIIKGMQDLVSEIDVIKSFEWGHDMESHEMLRQGFTHSFIMGFNNKEDYNTYTAHPKHAEYAAIFSAAIDKVILLDFLLPLSSPSTNPPHLLLTFLPYVGSTVLFSYVFMYCLLFYYHVVLDARTCIFMDIQMVKRPLSCMI